MPFNITQFKSELVGGGARPTLFEVQVTNPIVGDADDKLRFMAKTAALPGSSLGQTILPYFGRQVKYAGDRVFEDWNITVINDEDFLIRNAMEAWSNAINSHDSNTRALPSEYKSTGLITQYGKAGGALRKYVFEGMYPISIDAIPMSWESTDTIEEFAVTFQYDLWRVEGSTGISTT